MIPLAEFPPVSAEWTFLVVLVVILAGPLIVERLRRRGRPRRPGHRVRRLLALLGLAVALVAAPPAGAEDGPAAAEIAARHAPILGLRTQARPCAAGEPYRPVAVEVVLGSPDVLLVAPDRGTPSLPGPTAADLAGKGEGWRLDLPGKALRPGCTYERWFRAAAAGKPTVAYARVAGQADEPGRLALQYWLYYTYNDFNDRHEGDWEMLQLAFDASTAEEALGQEPVSVGVSQHEGGQVSPWRGGALSVVDGHPVIYPGAGSHANYFTQALWLGRDAEQGFGCDDTRAPTTLEQSEVVLLPDRVDDPTGPFAWLLFTGRWGEKRAGFNNGPTGPQTKRVWREPLSWHDDLRDDAVKVPGQGTFGQSVTGAFCWAVEAGSSALWFSIERPWVALGLALLVLGLVGTGLRRTRWSPAEPVPVARARTVGQILRAARRIYGQAPRTFLAIGVVFVPIALVVDGIQNLLLRVTPLATVREVSGDDSVASSLLALLIGGLGVSLGILLVTGAVAAALAARQRGASL
ncbi:MAG: hypothetical protein R3C15_21770, partial [Thermoleophilia bacterium]